MSDVEEIRTVGRCGDQMPSILPLPGPPPVFCALPAGHDGWHRGDQNEHGSASEWSR